jgi:predicted ATPase/class 3 adenylate cyclase
MGCAQTRNNDKHMSNNYPTGTVTFLFTDIEGSTKLAREHPEAWEDARARHHAILREAIESNRGYAFQIIGDAFCTAFDTAGDALRAAIQAQRVLQISEISKTSEILKLRVRMGIHTGAAESHNGEYRGYLTLSMIQRVMSAGHGGQILLSSASENLLRGQLPKDVTLRDLGEHKLKDVPQPVRIFQVVALDLQSEFPALRALDVFPNNLPTQLTSFVGREKEMLEVTQALTPSLTPTPTPSGRGEHRLVTLTGSGGTGKTRLSLQVASGMLEQFKDGVWFIELAPISEPGLVPNTVATVLRLRVEDSRPLMDVVMDWMRDKEVLFILDNCEHVIDACAQFANTILQNCRGVRILASSREALGIAGEVTYRVPSLPTPNETLDAHQLETFDSVQLFIQRATLTLPTFQLTDDNASFVAQICRRLDGIPLAIELAAARVKMLSVEQIAERLDDRFRLLTGGSRTALPRQQTLRALIDWSYQLLSEEERLLFRRLAVFVGGWTLDAAESVCGVPLSLEGRGRPEGSGEGLDVLELMTHLVDKSLINVEHSGGESRYHRLETIRQYAREKLFDTDEVASLRDKHLAYFAGLAERAEVELQGRAQKKWLARLEAEHDNLRAALEWSLKSQPETGLRIAAALREFWDTRGHLAEARKWLGTLLDATQSLPPDSTRVKALVAAMGFAARQTDLEGWRVFLDQEFTLARSLGDKWGVFQGLTAHALYKEHFENDYQGAEPLCLEAANLARELDDKLLIGQSLGPLASYALKRFEFARAEDLFRESLAMFRDAENEKEIAGALWNLAEVAFTRREYETARVSAEESLGLYRELDDKHGVATALRALSKTVQNQGRLEQSQSAGEQSVALFRELNDRGCLGITLPVLARSFLAQGNIQRAYELAHEAVTMTREIGEFGAEVEALYALGRVAIAQDDAPNARKHILEAMTLLKQNMDASQVPSLLDALAYALAISSQAPDAVRLLGAAASLREKTNLSLMRVEQNEYERTIDAVKSKVTDADFQSLWSEGSSMTMDETIRFALEKGGT